MKVFSVFFLFVSVFAVKQFDHLVLEGGGLQVISHVGALKALKELKYFTNNSYSFQRIGATSTASVVALAVALDVDSLHLESLVYNRDVFTETVGFDVSLLDPESWDQMPSSESSWIDSIVNFYTFRLKVCQIQDIWQIDDSPGLAAFETFETFIKKYIIEFSPHKERLVTATFRELYEVSGHDLVCFATRLQDGSLMMFSKDATPEENVLKAVYASMTLPGVFKPLDDGHGSPIVDGSLLLKFAINMNDKREGRSFNTLGLALSQNYVQKNLQRSASIGARYSKINMRDYLEMIYSVLVKPHMAEFDEDRVIYLASPLKVLSFKTTPSEVSFAMYRAYTNTISFMKNEIGTCS